MKDINYYKALNYKVCLQYSKEDNAWICWFPELKGCAMDAETAQEALRLSLKVKDEWLQVALDSNWVPNEPKELDVTWEYYVNEDSYICSECYWIGKNPELSANGLFFLCPECNETVELVE